MRAHEYSLAREAKQSSRSIASTGPIQQLFRIYKTKGYDIEAVRIGAAAAFGRWGMFSIPPSSPPSKPPGCAPGLADGPAYYGKLGRIVTLDGYLRLKALRSRLAPWDDFCEKPSSSRGEGRRQRFGVRS